MAFTLPPLPYGRSELEPHLSKETLDFHYGKHHQAYVTKLNAAVKGTPNESKTLEELIKTADGGVFNNAAQIWNHTFYWNSLSPAGGGQPEEPIKSKIDAAFGSFEKFKTTFTDAASGHFGSGWAWLVMDKEGNLKVTQTHDAGNPLRDGLDRPILTCDVWEHAYYIDHRNDRPKYIEAWWKLVNWEFANKNITAA